MSAQTTTPVDVVLGHLDGARRSGDGWSARCPAHTDKSPSLTIAVGADDRVLIHCQAGCTVEDVVTALGIGMADLFPSASSSNGTGRRIDRTYDYTDETGNLLYQVVRYEPKDFRQRRPNGQGWTWKLGDTRRVLYRLPQVLAAVSAGETTYVAEGEKDVDTLTRAGVVATCGAGGAGKWDTTYTEVLAGATVVVVADRDDPGRAHARTVTASLTKVGCQVTVVEAAIGKDASDHLSAGRTVDELVPVDQPSDEPGHRVLDDVAELLARYVAFPLDHHLVAVALWVAHAHGVDYAESTPRLALLSAEKQSGKTRTLEVLELLVPRPMFSSSTSAAAIFRSIAAVRPTLMIDEVDTIFGPAAGDHEELRGVLNAGHRRGAVVHRCDGPKLEVKEFPVFTPVVLAGIGHVPDTVADRAVVIRMKRRAPGDKVESFRRRKVAPAATELRQRVAVWVESVADELTDAEPDLDGLTDRPADVWEPLIAIADAAGGDWPERARAAAAAIVGAATTDDTSLGVRLLGDIRAIYTADNCEDTIPSGVLAERLAAMEEAPWGDLYGKALDARGLAKRLRPYDVVPHKFRVAEATHRGYRRHDFLDAWARYLPESGTSGTSGTAQVRDSDSVPPTPNAPEHGTEHGTGPEHDSPPLSRDVPDVPDVPVSEGAGGEAPDDDDQAVQRILDQFPGAERSAPSGSPGGRAVTNEDTPARPDDDIGEEWF